MGFNESRMCNALPSVICDAAAYYDDRCTWKRGIIGAAVMASIACIFVGIILTRGLVSGMTHGRTLAEAEYKAMIRPLVLSMAASGKTTLFHRRRNSKQPTKVRGNCHANKDNDMHGNNRHLNNSGRGHKHGREPHAADIHQYLHNHRCGFANVIVLLLEYTTPIMAGWADTVAAKCPPWHWYKLWPAFAASPAPTDAIASQMQILATRTARITKPDNDRCHYRWLKLANGLTGNGAKGRLDH